MVVAMVAGKRPAPLLSLPKRTPKMLPFGSIFGSVLPRPPKTLPHFNTLKNMLVVCYVKVSACTSDQVVIHASWKWLELAQVTKWWFKSILEVVRAYASDQSATSRLALAQVTKVLS